MTTVRYEFDYSGCFVSAFDELTEEVNEKLSEVGDVQDISKATNDAFNWTYTVVYDDGWDARSAVDEISAEFGMWLVNEPDRV